MVANCELESPGTPLTSCVHSSSIKQKPWSPLDRKLPPTSSQNCDAPKLLDDPSPGMFHVSCDGVPGFQPISVRERAPAQAGRKKSSKAVTSARSSLSSEIESRPSRPISLLAFSSSASSTDPIIVQSTGASKDVPLHSVPFVMGPVPSSTALALQSTSPSTLMPPQSVLLRGATSSPATASATMLRTKAAQSAVVRKRLETSMVFECERG
mmetsp:Transcript_13685/g.32535  ORF Transcript_13685/g.32535 Transcript_13685/m.32535 type:complete len:211 (-) Transcript_13685:20-652(-)